MPLTPPLQQVDRTYVLSQGQRLSYFGGCDYYRLASHPSVLRAVREGLSTHGLNVAASRKTTGNHALFEELERELAIFFKSPTAVLVGTGYMANLVAVQGLLDRFSHLLMDERSHGSLRDAAVFAGRPVRTFRHQDPADAAKQFHRLGAEAKPLLLTDGMFSHDGSVAPLREYLRLLPRRGAILLDEAHAAGVLGAGGRGTIEHLGLPADRIIRTLTLSKAFGVYGGVILGGKDVRDLILTRSHIFSGHTPLPLLLAQAALGSVRLLRSDPSIRARLMANAQLVKSRLKNLHLPETPSPIVSWVPPSPQKARSFKSILLKAGIHPPLIQYAGAPKHGYFRFAISSEHTKAQLNALVECLGTCG